MKAAALLLLAAGGVAAAPAGPIRTVTYDPMQVIHVPVARGVPTHIEFEEGEEVVSNVAAGLASTCRQAQPNASDAAAGVTADANPDAWDLCAPKKGRDLWVKPVGTSRLPNPVALRTNRRAYSFSFDVVEPARAVQRLTITSGPSPSMNPEAAALAQRTAAAAALEPKPAEILAARLGALPLVRNSAYERRTNKTGTEALPSAVFDDGRETCFQFRGNRPLPAIHRINADGTDQRVNFRVVAQMGRLLCVDQVAPGWRLRLGSGENAPVAELVNQAYDPEGIPPEDGTAVPGVVRVLRAPAATAAKE